MTFYHIGVNAPITPEEPLPELPTIKPGDLVTIEGRAPIWRYCIALHKLHGSAAGAVGIFDPRLGIVIVVSHSPNYQVGDILKQD